MKNKILVALLILVVGVFLAVGCDNATTPPIAEKESINLSHYPPRKFVTLDTLHPYDAINYGMFDDQLTKSTTVPQGGTNVSLTTEGKYSVFIPEGFQPKSTAVVILVPDDTTAEEFARSKIGLDWIEQSIVTKEFVVAFAEPEDGGKWNVSLDGSKRNEAAFLRDVFVSIRNKSITDNAFISVDKNGVSLVGYDEGASMAAVVAASWPAMFANTILVNPKSFDSNKVNSILEAEAYPFIIDGVKGYGDLTNGEIAMPMYVYAGNNSAIANQIVAKWSTINANAFHDDSTYDASLAVSKIITSSSAVSLYDAVKANNRYMGYPGGTVRTKLDLMKDARFENHLEEKIGDDGLFRRWTVFTPSSYDKTKETPLVVVLHGSSSAIKDIAEESRWDLVAEDNGFLVLYIQGYPRGTTGIPIPSWMQSAAALANEGRDNIDINYIEKVVDSVIASRNVDEERIYLTGHSLGSMMTTTVMNSYLYDKFAAYAPVGMLYGPQGNPAHLRPLWAMLGEYDMQGAAQGNTAALNWAKNQDNTVTGKSSEEFEAGYATEKFKTTIYEVSGDPLVKFTVASQSPHVYMAEESRLIWDRFFKLIKRTDDGSIVYTADV